jgi:hypothetical protein
MRENGIVIVGEAVYVLCNLVEAAEREENAKLCNSLARWHGQLVTAAFDHAADSIRYKGQATGTNEQDEALRTRSTYHGNNP